MPQPLNTTHASMGYHEKTFIGDVVRLFLATLSNNRLSDNLKRMALKRMDNVGIVVNDLKAAIAFFGELGMELVGEATVTGDWVDRLLGLNGVESEIAMMRTPDDRMRLELSKFKTPKVTAPDLKSEQMNTLGKHRIMFVVDDIKGTVARLRKHGAELVGEIVRYGDVYLLCFLRGPEGIMLALVEEIGK